MCLALPQVVASTSSSLQQIYCLRRPSFDPESWSQAWCGRRQAVRAMQP
ncbi:hypothetical protein M3J09_013248 [Ascochyta lentis]